MRSIFRYLVFTVVFLFILTHFWLNGQHYFSKSADQKSILLWTGFYNEKNWGLKNETMSEKFFEEIGCPETRCLITTNRTLKAQEEFDAIVFHVAENWNDVPVVRKSNQVYVAACLEAPLHTSEKFLLTDLAFNWTMTYRIDSDVRWPYGDFVDIETNKTMIPTPNMNWKPADEHFQDEMLLNSIKSKTKDIAWLVSNCFTQSKREILANELRKYIPIDIYGDCGNLTCTRGNESCNEMLTRDYFFYAAFENTLCQDYVTEKLYRAYKFNVVPIVYGSANYSLFAPPNSYIDVNEFRSVKELADYLKFLRENPEEYVKYFWWKKAYKVSKRKLGHFCDLCVKLHESDNEIKGKEFINPKSFWFYRTCFLESKLKFDTMKETIQFYTTKS